MIELDGFYPSFYEKGVVCEKCEDEWYSHALEDKYAKDIVTTNNANIQAYTDEFATEVVNTENLDFGDWIKYNTGLMPYIRKAAETVHWLHANGYTDYKVNMQAGIIK